MYECGYCHREFVRESAFMKHECKQMKRAKEIQTIEGQNAYTYYTKWMKHKRRQAPTIQTFMTSKYYTHFYKLAHHFKKLEIDFPEAYIRLMTKMDVDPNLWTRDEVYTKYLEYLDRDVDPMERVEYSIKEMLDIAEEKDCTLETVLDSMSPNEFIDLLRCRKITPWLLPHMTQMKRMVARFSDDHKKVMTNLIRPQYWTYMFQKNPQTVKAVKIVANELSL